MVGLYSYRSKNGNKQLFVVRLSNNHRLKAINDGLFMGTKGTLYEWSDVSSLSPRRLAVMELVTW